MRSTGISILDGITANVSPNHADYDVVSEQGSWTSGDPFTLTGIDGCLYGRGVIDNKGKIGTVKSSPIRN